MLDKNEALKLIQSVLINYNKEILTKLYSLKIDSLEKNNNIEFTPLEDYNPATKKYVDDSSEIVIGTSSDVINRTKILVDINTTPKTVLDTSNYQTRNDLNLNTKNKNIVASINEVNEQFISKANIVDFNFIRKDGLGTKALLDNGTYAEYNNGVISAVTLYNTLGDNIDGALSQKSISNKILETESYNLKDIITTVSKGKILGKSGELINNSQDDRWGVSDFIDVKDKVFWINNASKNTYPSICFYSSNSEIDFIESITAKDTINVSNTNFHNFNGYVPIPLGARFMKFQVNTSSNFISYQDFKYSNTFKRQFTNNIALINEKLIGGNKSITDINILEKNKGCRFNTDGTIYDSDEWWVISDYIEVNTLHSVRGYSTNGRPSIVKYDDSFNVVGVVIVDTPSGTIYEGSDAISPEDCKYYRVASNTSLGLIADVKYEVTLKEKVNELENYIINKKPYSSDYIYFKVKVNQFFDNNTDMTQSNQDNEIFANVPCVMKLPPTYTSNGKPSKVIMCCHGAGGKVNDNSYESAMLSNLFTNAGYVVFDVNGGTIDNGEHMSGSRALQAYLKAFEYIKDNYNVEDKVYVHGRSMGGLTALNFAIHNPSIVKCVACFYPVTDLYNQAWLRPWSGTCKRNMTIEHNFDDKTGNTFEHDKIIGYNPIENHSIVIEGIRHNTFPAPLKIWHGDNDTTVSLTNTRALVEALQKGGSKATLRVVGGAGHSFVDAIYSESLYWLNRY